MGQVRETEDGHLVLTFSCGHRTTMLLTGLQDLLLDETSVKEKAERAVQGKCAMCTHPELFPCCQ